MDSHHLFVVVSKPEGNKNEMADRKERKKARPTTKYIHAKWPKEIETKVENLKSFICFVGFVLFETYDNNFLFLSFFLPLGVCM